MATAARGGNKSVKDGLLEGVAGGGDLGVPLDAQKEGPVQRFHGLHQPGGAEGAHPQPGGGIVAGLMVAAVGEQAVHPKNAVQGGARQNDGGMVGAEPVFRVGVVFGDALGAQGGDVLHQTAAQGNVEHLGAPADAQQGLACRPRGVNEGKLRLIPHRVGLVRAGNGRLAEIFWVGIAAAGQQKPVKPGGPYAGHVGPPGQRHHPRPRPPQRRRVPVACQQHRQAVAVAHQTNGDRLFDHNKHP